MYINIISIRAYSDEAERILKTLCIGKENVRIVIFAMEEVSWSKRMFKDPVHRHINEMQTCCLYTN